MSRPALPAWPLTAGAAEGTKCADRKARDDEQLRLHRRRRRLGRGGGRAPAVGRRAQQGAAARSRRAERSLAFIPIGSARLIKNPEANWLYSAEPEANTKGSRLPVPRGNLLGGSSAINGMAFVRGQAQDFDTWAQMGNRGWSYEEVLPFFKRMEAIQARATTPIAAARARCASPTPSRATRSSQTLIKAAGQVGIPHNPDYNGARQEGIAMSQATIARAAA